jgi:hypothetical protein
VSVTKCGAKTGLNNSNTRIVADEVPTVIDRVRGKNARFVTVLEPHRRESNVRKVNTKPDGSASVKLKSGETISASLDGLLAKYGVH